MSTPTNPLIVEPVVVTPPASTTSNLITCEFCGSRLAPSGEFLSLGENAKKFREFDEVKLKKDARIAELELEVTALHKKISELEHPAPLETPVQKNRNTIFG